LNHYTTKSPVLIGVVSKSSKGFLYRTSKYNDKLKEYQDSVRKELVARNQQELIEAVAVELKKEIATY
jgi:hypothetical protein